jgi:REP element-mobilizing transposase RayT
LTKRRQALYLLGAGKVFKFLNSLKYCEYRSTRYVKYLCNYHFVWIPKYRRDVLVDEIAKNIKELLKTITQELGYEIISLEVMPDHIHLLVNCPPRYSPSYLSKEDPREVMKKIAVALENLNVIFVHIEPNELIEIYNVSRKFNLDFEDSIHFYCALKNNCEIISNDADMERIGARF